VVEGFEDGDILFETQREAPGTEIHDRTRKARNHGRTIV
jgi:hypothetical protein